MSGSDLTASYDDNEYSQWSSGSGSAAWIQYTLEGPANINQVVLKLPSFRTKSYRLKITVDDKQVWNSDIPTSLGYATLNFLPTNGTIVTVALDSDGSFGIIEAEIYAPI